LSDLFVSLRLVLRARFLTVSLWVVLALAAIVLLATQFSARQPATIALDVGFSLMRFTLPLFAILLAQELIGREFERRYCLTSFTYPRAREQWLLGRFSAIAILVLGLLAVMAAVLAGLTMYAATQYDQGTPVSLGAPYITALGFLAVDLLVVSAVATLLAVAATTPSFVLIGSIGFVLVARAYGAVIELLRQDSSFVAKLADPEKYRASLSTLNFVLPDLGVLDVRMVALYGKMAFLPPDWPLRLAGTLFYAIALLALAAWLLRRRDFG
jgi:ABC-type transport system involved in multi-copper enzyme maturation permease subunit